MTDAQGAQPAGSAGEVAFSDRGGGFAYRPGIVLVGGERGRDEAARVLPGGWMETLEPVFQERAAGQIYRFEVPVDPLEVIEELRLEGVTAQPDHVLFAHCGCGCGPHPAVSWQACQHETAFGASPFHASPFHASPFHASPFHASTAGATGRRSSSARPAAPPTVLGASERSDGGRGSRRPSLRRRREREGATTRWPRIVVLDTGLTDDRFRPAMLGSIQAGEEHWERPDEDHDDHLDPVAGHGTFIAGLIDQLVPECDVKPVRVLSTMGDGGEASIAAHIDDLATAGGVDLLNLSFGGFALERPHALQAAVRRVQAAGTVVVASAGNEATCRPCFPASLPGVVSVAALSTDGPAPFTNHGDWVRSCAPGVDIVAPFFAGFQGAKVAPANEDDPDDFHGWARWSGTSFAAPMVVAALAREMRRSGISAADAVTRVIDAPGLLRIPRLGTVVNIS